MVVPAFGFSVGDFITGIEAAIEVIKAYRETRGAISQYRQTPAEFQAYLSTFRRLQDPQVATTAEIISIARNCEGPIQCFMKKVEKYQDSLTTTGTSTGGGLVHSVRKFPRKAQWAVRASKEIEKLRAGLGPPLSTIGLLLDLELRYVKQRPRNQRLLKLKKAIFVTYFLAESEDSRAAGVQR